ncbi:MAG: VOC family protein [Saprospiraceae bacterium]|nr:VOC family protein [Saprospiraceae bacterium]
MALNKISPSLWFSVEGGQLATIIDYYQTIFGNNFKPGQVIPLGDTPSGYAEMCQVVLFEQEYTLMSTALEHHALNDAVSFIIYCADQHEIDHYWNHFTREGKQSQCGWCEDKFGLRWQVLPENLGELMQKPNAWNVMMSQRKIVIAEY